MAAKRTGSIRLLGLALVWAFGCYGGGAEPGEATAAGPDSRSWMPPDWHGADAWEADAATGDGDAHPNAVDYGVPTTWDGTTSGATAPAAFALAAAKDCAELTSLWRQQAILEMERDLTNLWYVVTRPGPCYHPGDEGSWGYADVAVCDASSDVGESRDSGGATEYSTTNTQEVDVDEADFLENDGTYVYMLANGAFRVLQAYPADQAKPLSRVAIEGEPRSMFVRGDRAVIFSSLGSLPGYGDGTYGAGSTCTYGYDCELTGDGRPLKVTVLDLADRTNPVLQREIRFDGTFLASRRINDIVYTVLYSPPPRLPTLPSLPDALQGYAYRCDEDPFPFTEAELRTLFRELHDANLAEIDSWVANALLPHATDRVRTPTGWATLPDPFQECERYLLSGAGDGGSLLSLVSFDQSAREPLEVSSVLTRPGAVYTSSQSLYVASRHEFQDLSPWFQGEPLGGLQEATTIHKFSLDEASARTTYEASGVARGRILNPFSLSEHDGYLRVATTSGYVYAGATNAIRVFEQEGERLREVGVVDQLAPDEDIRSVRFDGDRGYVVTFKKTDPLYVLDLSDPRDPKVTGELKIPGFSTYMHFLDPTHLLTIGFDADDMGDFAWFAGIALQVFDVTDGSNPSLLHREVIGTRGTSSDAATNHLAFNWFAPRQALALPMVVCEGGSAGVYGDRMTFNGLMVYRVDVAEGFSYLGGIPHEVPAADPYGTYDYASCGTWWSQSTSSVKRSVFMDDWVYSIAFDEIRVARIDELATPVAVLPLLP
jgi:hypothetical protein